VDLQQLLCTCEQQIVGLVQEAMAMGVTRGTSQRLQQLVLATVQHVLDIMASVHSRPIFISPILDCGWHSTAGRQQL